MPDREIESTVTFHNPIVLRDFETPQAAGTYRLVFATGGPFFPEVVVVFRVTEPDRHHHVPVLLSPYGYTTYRGS